MPIAGKGCGVHHDGGQECPPDGGHRGPSGQIALLVCRGALMEIGELIESSPEGFRFQAGGILPPAAAPGDMPDRLDNLH
jgi:hypothetical protein